MLDLFVKSPKIRFEIGIRTASPTSGAIFTEENDGSAVYRTDSAQISAESERRNVTFPKVIHHRKAEVTIYGKRKSYLFYRLAYRVNGKRRMKSFRTYAEAKKEADKKFGK